jgi:hypothetical protein
LLTFAKCCRVDDKDKAWYGAIMVSRVNAK